jgi:CysZ protein
VVLVASLVPVLNALAPLLWFAFGAWTMAIQFSDYPTENRGRPFHETVALLQRNRSAALGFGACATVALALPLINLLLIPGAVAGGTILYRRMQDNA